MKTIISGLFLVLVAFVIVGCEKAPEPAPAPAPTNAPAAP
jgi:hypothetical protein